MAHSNITTGNPASKNILAGIASNVAFNPRPAGGYAQRPSRPEVGPQTRYNATSHNIAMGDGPDDIWFDEAGHSYRADLEWVLFSLEQFDEPSRHWILAATAWKYGIPFEVLMGGML